ncbi:biotin--[acetyl-CoA-carboxylase] ligase [Coxiella burnetii]|uniref:Bifunctional ligase/repressor BirA n=2 Tax=Coxiella burnetii TaxID=777 RepID=Q83CV0_COXBU|nr:biotin--[acetyl-CoA-carboxylase] ligase [Coxiella burnetii]NP_820009.1 biotin operon repressor [Coxiella burnetii RSA 493]AAO90523.1 biotin operon repressor [Coxiella burnetii RSA 493]ABS77139.1 biotin operon repressor [Coxiella burnetii Dugway 5J108-111]ABX78023.1 bifunctional protein birA [Coxiella burnetii RSA 331]ACJ20079.1 biotin operon repressor [Coxiella burnetii CbuK_Q154]AIT63116.1 Biotin operon repressor [Coxiella burnetii str. Namibia]
MKNSQNHLAQIVALLNDRRFHPGTAIGQALNISRTAVWKTVQKLKKYEIPITADKSKGYRLERPFLLLDPQKIKNAVQAEPVRIDLFEQINSTNEYLKRVNHPQQLNICLAEMQTQGKGRFQRAWHSPFGQNIYLSLKYPFHKDVSELAGLSLVCGLAVCNAIEENCPLTKPIFVKWPNDIICEDKKLAGILIEIEAETHGFCSAIIGIGLNVNMEKEQDKINQPWISIKNLTATDQDRNQLCAALINQLVNCIDCFEKKGFNEFLASWKTKDYLLNKQIQLKSGRQELQGKSLGINPQGYLTVQLSDGSERIFSSGDTTLLK